jgi:hypothetical protein
MKSCTVLSDIFFGSLVVIPLAVDTSCRVPNEYRHCYGVDEQAFKKPDNLFSRLVGRGFVACHPVALFRPAIEGNRNDVFQEAQQTSDISGYQRDKFTAAKHSAHRLPTK